MSSRSVRCADLQLDDRIDEFDNDKQSRRTTLSLSHDRVLFLLFLASLFHFHRGRYIHALPAPTQARPADQALWTIVGEAWFTGKTNVSATLLTQTEKHARQGRPDLVVSVLCSRPPSSDCHERRRRKLHENGDSHVVLPTSGPDDVLGHVLGCQRLEPFVDLFRGLFVTPETGDGEG
jgi:hypothetical protein